MAEVVGSTSVSGTHDHPSALLTFLLADIRGYTRYSAEQGDQAAARLSERFLSLCREVVTSHGGEVFGSAGDQALAAFTSAHAALYAAVALQSRLDDEQASHPEHPFMAGIGLDTGEGIKIGDDYRGNAINLAARLCSLAGAGEIFASEAVITVARKVEGLVVVDRGEVTLKGLSHPVRVVQIGPAGSLPDSLPPLQPILVTHPTNLPDEPTPFIGRSSEIVAITALLGQPGVRLVTLLGPGGTGKTRLALQVGMNLLYAYRDGVFFCDLSALTDSSLVPSTIAETLGVKAEGSITVLDALRAYLSGKHLLLVLDNCEQVIEAATEIGTLLDSCREFHVLATSRTPLHLAREREYAVAPLPVPDASNLPPIDQMRQYDAVALFVERAEAANHGFSLTDENVPAIAAICSRLDGLPLAIELAAARIKLFPPAALLQRLERRLPLLTGGARDRPTRQQTLRATIDWSYSLLTEEEQTLIARLAVFAGGWTFEAAESVCDPDGAIDLLEGMTSLIEKSLVRQEGEEEPRFSMLETIREYAVEKLEERGEKAAIRQRHADVYLDLAERAGPRVLGSGDPVVWLNQLGGEHDNLRAALGWFLAQGDAEHALRLAGAVWVFWLRRNLYAEGRRWLESALALPGAAPPALVAMALRGASAMASEQGDLEGDRRYAEESLAHYRESGDLVGTAYQCKNLGNALFRAGDYEGALRYNQESEALAQQITDPTIASNLKVQALSLRAGINHKQGNEDEMVRLLEEAIALQRREGFTLHLANFLGNLAIYHREHGNYDRAAALIEEAFVVAEHLGDVGDIANLYSHRSTLRLYQGDLDGARRDQRACVTMARESGSVWAMLNALGNAFMISVTEGNAIKAAQLFGAHRIAFERMGMSLLDESQRMHEPYVSTARAQLGEAAFEAAREAGAAMSLEEAVAYALGEVHSSIPTRPRRLQ